MHTVGTIPTSYDYRLVSLSVVIAIFASYTALSLAGRVTASRDQARLAWLVGGAIAMGTGIWSMHYTGMLAFRLPIRVYYHVPTVFLSLLAAIFASCIALWVVSRPRVTTLHIVGGSLLMGGAIATMHYTGMAAMRLAAHHHYHRGLWLLSVLLAVVISLAALALTIHFRDENRGRLLQIAISVVMGLAIPIMHYTGMAAVSYMPTNAAPDLSNAIDISVLANSAVILITLVILSSALLSSLVNRRFSAQARELILSEQLYQQEKRLSRLDPLTGLANRRAFYEGAELERQRAVRYGRNLSMAYIDLDNFKQVNDNFGHKAGDQLLVTVAIILRSDLRPSDLAARLGGDEFAVVLPETDELGARRATSKLHVLLTQAMQDNDWPVTFSMGVVTFNSIPETVEQMVHKADELMYTVKHGGKNRIATFILQESSSPSVHDHYRMYETG